MSTALTRAAATALSDPAGRSLAQRAPDPSAHVLPADAAACRAHIRHHSKSFYLSSLLLPRALRPETWALYAFCRQADDTVDGDNPGDGTVPADARTEPAVLLARVAALRKRLRRVYAAEGRGEVEVSGSGIAAPLGSGEHARSEPLPDRPIDRAFAAVVRRTGMPQALPQRLLDGMELDARGTVYRTYEELLGYCFHVASTVGLMMTCVMGYVVPEARREEVLLRASDLGVAMQLSNIARDVGEDARRGRVYLPDELLRAHGLDAAQVLAICQRPDLRPEDVPAGLRAAVRELLARADAHYRAASLGIPMLPRGVRLAIRSAQRIYAAIGDRLRAQGYDAVTRRAYVGTLGKLARIAGAFLRGLWPVRVAPAPTVGPADATLRRLCREAGLL